MSDMIMNFEVRLCRLVYIGKQALNLRRCTRCQLHDSLFEYVHGRLHWTPPIQTDNVSSFADCGSAIMKTPLVGQCLINIFTVHQHRSQSRYFINYSPTPNVKICNSLKD